MTYDRYGMTDGPTRVLRREHLLAFEGAPEPYPAWCPRCGLGFESATQWLKVASPCVPLEVPA